MSNSIGKRTFQFNMELSMSWLDLELLMQIISVKETTELI